MRRDELAIEQFDAPQAQRHHQPAQGNLAGLADPAEHAFAAEHAVKADAIETADQPLLAAVVLHPAFDRMGMAHGMQPGIGGRDSVADPGFARFGHARRRAGLDHLLESSVAGDAKAPPPQGARQRMRAMHAIEWQNATPFGLHPEDLGIITMVGHGEDAAAIGQQHEGRIDDRVGNLGPRVAHDQPHASFARPTRSGKARLWRGGRLTQEISERHVCLALAMSAQPI